MIDSITPSKTFAGPPPPEGYRIPRPRDTRPPAVDPWINRAETILMTPAVPERVLNVGRLAARRSTAAPYPEAHMTGPTRYVGRRRRH